MFDRIISRALASTAPRAYGVFHSTFRSSPNASAVITPSRALFGKPAGMRLALLAAFIDEPDRVTAAQYGSMVSRLRQLGNLRHRLLSPVRPHGGSLDEGRAVARPVGRVRERRRSHFLPASRCTTSSR